MLNLSRRDIGRCCDEPNWCVFWRSSQTSPLQPIISFKIKCSSKSEQSCRYQLHLKSLISADILELYQIIINGFKHDKIRLSIIMVYLYVSVGRRRWKANTLVLIMSIFALISLRNSKESPLARYYAADCQMYS